MALTTSELIHLPLVGYFVGIAFLLALILPAFLKRNPRPSSIFFTLMAGQSLLATWKWMFRYFSWSWATAAARAGNPYLSSAEWLRRTSLFEEAWFQVCKTTEAWWTTEQLCAWTAGPLTIFFVVEGKRRGIKHVWAYMLLGQVVAISVAQNLFCAALCLGPRSPALRRPTKKADGTVEEPEKEYASWTLLASVGLSLLSIGLTPKLLNGPYFLLNLLAMHAVLIIPFLPFDPLPTSSLTYAQAYTFAALIALRLRLPSYQTLFEASKLSADGFSLASVRAWLPDLAKMAYKTLYAHPANASIGLDVVFATVSFLIYMFYENQKSIIKTPWLMLLGLASMTPLTGIAVTGGLYLGARESDLEDLEVKRLAELKLQKAQELKTDDVPGQVVEGKKNQ